MQPWEGCLCGLDVRSGGFLLLFLPQQGMLSACSPKSSCTWLFQGVLLALCSAEEGTRTAGCARGAFHSCLHSSPPCTFLSGMVGNDRVVPKTCSHLVLKARRGFVCHFLSPWKKKKSMLPECLCRRGSPGKEIRSEEMCHQQKAQLFLYTHSAERSPAHPAAV